VISTENSMNEKKIIVLSAINFFEGGPLSVLKDCLQYIESSNHFSEYKIIALIHRRQVLSDGKYQRVKFIEFPLSRKSYLFRLFYEYCYFKRLSKRLRPSFWFSLHDITPNVGNVPQAVYCHNPSPFNTINLDDLLTQPTQFYFRLFYKFIYKINIKKNTKVVVQQHWIAEKFREMFGIESSKILVSKPEVSISQTTQNTTLLQNARNDKVFFFPTLARPFKNIELICKAVKILNERMLLNFRVVITIDGSENRYSSKIISEYGALKNLDFIGFRKRHEIFDLYRETDCLLFPSKLETWGLPLTEFMNFNRAIFVSDLPYAHETLGNYNKAFYFDPFEEVILANAMEQLVKNHDTFKYSDFRDVKKVHEEVNSWEELFNKLIFS
jgi:glycosyltransferase involved in cell wall biosynthesis